MRRSRNTTVHRASDKDLAIAEESIECALIGYGISHRRQELDEGRKPTPVTEARSVAVYLMRKLTDDRLSYNQIGDLVGIAHASAFSAFRRVNDSAELMRMAEFVKPFVLARMDARKAEFDGHSERIG